MDVLFDSGRTLSRYAQFIAQYHYEPLEKAMADPAGMV
ncbi:hypothetical protein N599_00730 [Saccharopolyspora erythraea D]|nr:hypothetical protein N599_00730 [Saccharopolyspora erythraea D]